MASIGGGNQKHKSIPRPSPNTELDQLYLYRKKYFIRHIGLHLYLDVKNDSRLSSNDHRGLTRIGVCGAQTEAIFNLVI